MSYMAPIALDMKYINKINIQSKLISTRFTTKLFDGVYTHSEWQISKDKDFNTFITKISKVSDSLSFDENEFESGAYFARVKHCSNEISSEWSDIYSFEIIAKHIHNPVIMECTFIGKKLFVSLDDFKIDIGLNEIHKYTIFYLYDILNREIFKEIVTSPDKLLETEISFDFKQNTTYYLGVQFGGIKYKSDITKYKFYRPELIPISISKGVMHGDVVGTNGDYLAKYVFDHAPIAVVEIYKNQQLSLNKVFEIEIIGADGKEFSSFVSNIVITDDLDIIITENPLDRIFYQHYLQKPNDISGFTQEYSAKVYIYKKVDGKDKWEYNSSIKQPKNTGFNMTFGVARDAISVTENGNRIAIMSTYLSDNLYKGLDEPFQDGDLKKTVYIFEKNDNDDWEPVFETYITLPKPYSVSFFSILERAIFYPILRLKFSKDGTSLICVTSNYNFKYFDKPIFKNNLLVFKKRTNGIWTEDLIVNQLNNPTAIFGNNSKNWGDFNFDDYDYDDNNWDNAKWNYADYDIKDFYKQVPIEYIRTSIGDGFSISDDGLVVVYSINQLDFNISKIIVKTFDGIVWLTKVIDEIMDSFVVSLTINDNYIMVFIYHPENEKYSIRYYKQRDGLKDVYDLVYENSIHPAIQHFDKENCYFHNKRLILKSSDNFEIFE